MGCEGQFQITIIKKNFSLLISLFCSHDIIDDGTITTSLPPDVNKMVDLADGIVKSVLQPVSIV